MSSHVRQIGASRPCSNCWDKRGIDPDGVMRFKASAGLSEDYRAAVEGHTPWRPGQPAPEPVVVPDVTVDESLKQYRRNLPP